MSSTLSKESADGKLYVKAKRFLKYEILAVPFAMAGMINIALKDSVMLLFFVIAIICDIVICMEWSQ